jgi:hypothetical protein
MAHVAHMGKKKNTLKILVEKNRRKRDNSEDIDIDRKIIMWILKIGRRG